ncbi:MAG TPA: hypothetical protein VF492_01715 [Verrucomicrobiae bacterium]
MPKMPPALSTKDKIKVWIALTVFIAFGLLFIIIGIRDWDTAGGVVILGALMLIPALLAIIFSPTLWKRK